MTTGASGTYAINNTDFALPPTTGKWIERTSYGIDGEGHVLYPAFRAFEMTWELIGTNDLNQLLGFYNTVSSTGTAVACLPEWGNANYIFKNYSGTTIVEPTVGEYFQGYVTSVTMKILNARTN